MGKWIEARVIHLNEGVLVRKRSGLSLDGDGSEHGA